jgi:RecA-family ATPase
MEMTKKQEKFYNEIQRIAEDLEIRNDESIKPVTFIVPDFLMKSGLTILGGDSGSGKTMVALNLGICCATGTSFLGREISEKYSVLYIDEENRLEILKERATKLENSLGVSAKDNFHLTAQEDFILQDDNDSYTKVSTEKIYKLLEEYKPNIIFFDSLVRFMTGDENSVRDVRKLFLPFKKFMNDFKCCLVAIHHTKKSGSNNRKSDLRGSTDILNMADIVFLFSKGKEKNSITQVKNRVAPQLEKEIKFRLAFENDTLQVLWMGEKREPDLIEKCQRDILQHLQDCYDDNFLYNKTNFKSFISKKYPVHSTSTIYRAIEDLIESEQLIVKNKMVGIIYAEKTY